MAAGKGFNAPMQVSEELGAIVGNKPKSRGQVVKKLWEYIKANKLQDKKDKRVILASQDKKLGKVLGKKDINMFQMTKKVSAHLSKVAD